MLLFPHHLPCLGNGSANLLSNLALNNPKWNSKESKPQDLNVAKYFMVQNVMHWIDLGQVSDSFVLL